MPQGRASDLSSKIFERCLIFGKIDILSLVESHRDGGASTYGIRTEPNPTPDQIRRLEEFGRFHRLTRNDAATITEVMNRMDKDVLRLLRCLETRQPLDEVEDQLLEALNEAISNGELKNRNGDIVERPMTGALINQDHSFIYPIFDGIPVLIRDEAIPFEGRLFP